jgi:hypothetical protein
MCVKGNIEWSDLEKLFFVLLQGRGEETHVMAAVSSFWFSVSIFFDSFFSATF